MTQLRQTLLLVDDDDMGRDSLSRRLTAAGYVVVTAASGLDALGVLSHRRVDAVLLDVMMPAMSGVETLRRLRQMRSQSELPVIMVTARDEGREIVEALDGGADDYVTKPIDFPVLLARIRTQMASRRADLLTGLPNSVFFMERLNGLVLRHQVDPDCTFAVLFLDIDRFKHVNDTLGHRAGDELLVAVSRRLEAHLGTADVRSRLGSTPILARIGGDEFTILVDGVREPSDAHSFAEDVRAVLSQPVPIQGSEIVLSVSIGVVMSAARYLRPDDMVHDSDTAMRHAKQRGGSRWEMFDPAVGSPTEGSHRGHNPRSLVPSLSSVNSRRSS